MGQILHGSATTTHAIRAAIQRSKASLQALSERYGINPKTVAKMTEAPEPRRPTNGPEGSTVDGAIDARRNVDRGFSSTDVAATR